MPSRLRIWASAAQSANPLAPSGEDLVGVALVTDVPDQQIARRVVHVVQRNTQFDGAETRGEVTSGGSYGLQQVIAQLVSNLRQLGISQTTQVGGGLDVLEERAMGGIHGRLAPCRLARLHRQKRSLCSGSTIRMCSRTARAARVARMA